MTNKTIAEIIKPKVGKHYKDESGSKVTIVKLSEDGRFALGFRHENDSLYYYYTQHGRVSPGLHSGTHLVEKWSENQGMSYDIFISVDTGGQYPCNISSWNPTYNLSEMFHTVFLAAGVEGFHAIHKMNCREAIPILENIISILAHPDNAETYEKLEPKNGWGSKKTALTFLNELLDGCRAHPKAFIRTCAEWEKN